uniref:5'-deoxynucleotidase n=1 Tax=Araucaria cunninghamii TaxID=56994 RepID=A0A0D6QX42_ARACU
MGVSTAALNSLFLRGGLNPCPSSSGSAPWNSAIKLNCREECRRATIIMQQPQSLRSVSSCASRKDGGHVALPGTEGLAPENGTRPENSGGLRSSSPSPSSAIDFLMLCQELKTTKRKGWVNQGIENAESIADHMYRMAVMALIAGDLPGINRERCVKMALVHDIAEDGIPKEEKSRRERKALDEMCQLLGGGLRAEEIRELWNEYENNSSPEANLVKDFDKVELILQALEYENEHGKVWEEFFESTKGKIQTDIGKKWAAEIHARRNKRLDHTCT